MEERCNRLQASSRCNMQNNKTTSKHQQQRQTQQRHHHQQQRQVNEVHVQRGARYHFTSWSVDENDDDDVNNNSPNYNSNNKRDDGDNNNTHNDTNDSTASSAFPRHSVKYSSLASVMSEAVVRGDTKLLRRLVMVNEKLPPTKRQLYMANTMAEAIEAGKAEIVDTLLDGKAQASGSHMGLCHLARAIKCGRIEIVQSLIRAGADVNAWVDNKTILHIAASVASVDIVQILLDNSCHIDTKDFIQGNTALHLACSYCNTGAVRALIQYGAEFNTPNSNGDTPLAKLLRNITKNKEDWHNTKTLQLARVLIQIGLMIFPPYRDETDNETRHRPSRRSNRSQRRSSSPTPSSLSAFNLIPSALSHTGSKRKSKSLTCSTIKSNQSMFVLLSKSLEQHDDRSENMDEFSSRSSSTLSSSSSSSLSSSESSLPSSDFSEQIILTSGSNQNPKRSPWWKKKEIKMVKLYDRLVSETRGNLTLQQHCRLCILRCIETRPLKTSVNTLHLPRMVQRFIYGQGGWEMEP